jgi:hypothetical protein
MPATDHPYARRAIAALATLVIAAAGVLGLLLFFNSRDDSHIANKDSTSAGGPGQVFPDLGARHLGATDLTPPYNSDPPTSGPHRVMAVRRDGAPLTNDQLLNALELGNVVIFYGAGVAPATLHHVAGELMSGSFDPSLAAAGQAVIIAPRPGVRGVVAVAWRHLQRAASPADPVLRDFAEAWLGRGAGS